jgi:hemolysin III
MNDPAAPRAAGQPLYPRYRAEEVRADRCVHWVGITAGALGVIALLAATLARADAWLLLGTGLYGAGLLLMLSLSASYNLTQPSRRKEYLRRFDHAGIFIMIAGTYTPFFLNRVGGAWGWGMLAFVWSVALAGVALAFAAPRRHELLQAAVYLLLGWSVLVAIHPLGEHVSQTAARLLLAGGIIYSLGVPVHLWRNLRFNNAIWHALVLVAACCHYAAVMIGVVLAS